MGGYLRKSRFVIGVLIALLAVGPVAVASAAGAPGATKKFTDCTALLKQYKSGVASSKKTKGKTKAYLSASVYAANKKLDLDGNGIACDAGDLKSSQTSAGKKFTAKTYKGSGDKTFDVAIPAGAVAIAQVDFDGEDGVTLMTFDADENPIDTPVASYGPYSGTVFLSRGTDPDSPSDVASLDVSGDGNWTIKIMPASGADAFDGSAKGKKDTVLRYSGDDIDIAATHDGEDEFMVSTYDKNGVLVETTLDEYGEIDDSYPMAAGAYIAIKTSGNWTLDEE